MPTFGPIPADTDAARRLFFDKGRSPNGLVPDVIERSWQRCARRLDNADAPPAEHVDLSLLNERREMRGQLRRIVRPEMDALAELVSDGDSLVVLADRDGLILDAVGALNFLRTAQQVALQPGVYWSEDGRGTNAIGTALAEQQAVSVRGRQHYLEANGILSCAAAPILSPRGEMLGVLDVSGDSENLHAQALGMVRLAIQIIEHRLSLTQAQNNGVLRFHPSPELLNTHREGVLLLDEDRIVGANRAALQLLGADWQDLLDTSAEQWLQLPASNQPKVIRGRDGQQMHGVVQQERKSPVAIRPLQAPTGEPCYFDDDCAAKLTDAKRVLDAGIAVLVNGETGTGKEVFARQLHAVSARSHGAFVAVNCAALPESLIESELFGYQGGAFTDARRKGMPGRIREADGGILFLDEIGDMPLALQARLLRVLQEKNVVPLGGGQPVSVDFALVCATNRDLQTMVEAGEFRADLFYRIQDFTLNLPPLRERNGRPRLIESLMRDLGKGEIALDDEAVQALSDYDWPGNLRQLTSVLRTLIALSSPGDIIAVERLPTEIRNRHKQQAVERQADNTLQTKTRDAIEQALVECDGCVSAAARQLGIHRSTIHRWIAKHRH
ncbi:sigma-54-dependent Fis family transcriptional regulator [Thiosocius teredinicola]|uniref:sigma-54-dependent Fis family transcriptional regulator n=1 Tax=Thiosocius teredinicola TaxID=1973002 RepID=UPI000990D67A